MSRDYSDIKSLEGEEINAISFVMDYVEIHFNGPIIRCLKNPIISYKDYKVEFPAEGSRDFLCSLIGEKVAQILINNVQFELTTNKGKKIIVNLYPTSTTSPETIHYVPGKNLPMQIW